MLTNVVSTITNVGRYFLHTLAVQNSNLLGEGTGQLLVDGPGQQVTATLTMDSGAPQRVFTGGCSNRLALVEGLHGTLPLLQLKLHHPGQICSIGLQTPSTAATVTRSTSISSAASLSLSAYLCLQFGLGIHTGALAELLQLLAVLCSFA